MQSNVNDRYAFYDLCNTHTATQVTAVCRLISQLTKILRNGYDTDDGQSTALNVKHAVSIHSRIRHSNGLCTLSRERIRKGRRDASLWTGEEM